MRDKKETATTERTNHDDRDRLGTAMMVSGDNPWAETAGAAVRLVCFLDDSRHAACSVSRKCHELSRWRQSLSRWPNTEAK
jgi:hypothetical protein